MTIARIQRPARHRERGVTESPNRSNSLVENPVLPEENLAESCFHKLSQPIGAMYASLELGLMSDDATQLKAAIEASLTQLHRLRWLFQIARQFFATDFCARARSISLRECIDAAVSDSRPLAEENDVTIYISVKQDSQVLADPVYLRDAVENLLSWCIRNSAQRSAINFEVFADGSTAHVELSDQNRYDAQSAKNVFEPFAPGVQIGPGESGNLDLALSQRIIRAFGGNLELRASPNGTNCFGITLPLCNPQIL